MLLSLQQLQYIQCMQRCNPSFSYQSSLRIEIPVTTAPMQEAKDSWNRKLLSDVWSALYRASIDIPHNTINRNSFFIDLSLIRFLLSEDCP